MASVKISALPAATSVADADLVPIVQGGTTKKAASSLISSANSKLSSVGFSLDGAGSVLTTGLVGYTTVPYAGTITAWSITADGASPTCTIDVWKVGTGTSLPNSGNSIMGVKPALSSGNAIRSTTFTNWITQAVTANDIIGFNLDAVTVATKLTFELEITKT